VIKRIIPWAIAGIALACCVATIYSFMAYRDVVNKIVASEEFSDLEDYGQAITILESAMTSWIVQSFGVKRETLENLSTAAATRKLDKRHFEDGIDVGSYDLLDGINKLSEIAQSSHYFDQSQIKIGEFRIQLLELELDSADEKIKKIEEEIKRLLISNKSLETTLNQETESKLVAESLASMANQRADDEAAAKEFAQEQAAYQERVAQEEAAAKEFAQEQAAYQERVAQEEAAAKELAQQQAAYQERVAQKEAAAKRLAQQQAAYQERVAQEEAAAKELAQQQAAEQAAVAKQIEKERILILANTHPMIQAVVSGELKFYFKPLPWYAGPEVSRGVEEIAQSLSAWNPYNATIRRVYSASSADLVVDWVKDYGTHVLGESIYKSHIKVGLGTDNCRGDWMAFDSNSVKKVLWHEIGHSMGYSHSSDPTNVMYPTTTTHLYVEQDISETIASGWFMTFPLCESGQYLYSIESANSYEGFDIYVLPPGTDAATVGSGGLVYTDCGSVGMASFSNSCNVSLGASIYISPTHYYNGVTITGEVITPDQSVWPDMVWDASVFQYETSDMLYYRDLFR